MLLAFIVVILLGIGGMAGMYQLASVGQETQSEAAVLSAQADRQWGALNGELDVPAVSTHPVRPGDWRGIVSAMLLLGAVLLSVATFFSSRVSRPITRLTRAAQTMASGDLDVRVQNFGVREINDLAEAFNTMASSLATVDRQRRQLTADVAHELRTPLSIIRGRLEGMQDGVYSAGPEQLAALLAETALMERLIEDLRLLALADAGQLPLYPETFSPPQLLHSVARSFAHQAEAGKVTVQVTTAPNLPELWADPQRIAQVLGNLATNALRYTPPGGTITLSAWYDTVEGQPQVCMAVADTGTGIAQEDLPHIFDRFWRADRSRARSSGGAGLGLAIAKRIIDAHQGRIWAYSDPGQGTTVAFSLPLVASTTLFAPYKGVEYAEVNRV
jgi:two-component system OmpR family sensor kinase/two-component system sensor histidine kinase BaeS